MERAPPSGRRTPAAALAWAAVAWAQAACTGGGSGAEFAPTGGLSTPPAEQTAPDANSVPADPNDAAPPAKSSPPTCVVVGRVSWPSPGDGSHFVSSWCGTTVGVRLRGTGLVVRMADTHRLPLADPDGGYGTAASLWDVAVDGVPAAAPLVAGRVAADVVAAHDLALGEHEVWLVRRTEAVRTGRAEIFGLRAVGGELLTPPSPRVRRLEVIGTSVETGMHAGATATDANEVQRSGCGDRFGGQNQSRAWPKVVAERLGAELTNTAVEGAGLVVGYTGYAGAGVQIPGIFPRTDLFVPTPPWRPESWQVDVVLSAAGWSDISFVDPSDATTASRLKAAYVEFLAQLRAAQPTAMIYGVVRTGDDPKWNRAPMAAIIESAVAARRSADDLQVRTLTLPAWSSTASNCDDHPTWAQHQALADAATPVLRADLGW